VARGYFKLRKRGNTSAGSQHSNKSKGWEVGKKKKRTLQGRRVGPWVGEHGLGGREGAGGKSAKSLRPLAHLSGGAKWRKGPRLGIWPRVQGGRGGGHQSGSFSRRGEA